MRTIPLIGVVADEANKLLTTQQKTGAIIKEQMPKELYIEPIPAPPAASEPASEPAPVPVPGNPLGNFNVLYGGGRTLRRNLMRKSKRNKKRKRTKNKKRNNKGRNSRKRT